MKKGNFFLDTLSGVIRMEESEEGPVTSQNLSFQWIIVIVGVLLLLIKFGAWLVTSSVSVLTDALESIVNVVAAFVGLYALALSAKPRDKSHPYGHGKVELISSSLEGVMILVAGAVIIFEAVDSFFDSRTIDNLPVGLGLLALTALVNLAVGVAAMRKGRKNRSLALVASGKHLCSDTVSSLGIILGLGVMMLLSYLGYDINWVDSAIAAVFGVIIAFTGIKVVKESMDGVMDKADESAVEDILLLVNGVRHNHWIDIHNLRVTKYGPMLHVEFHMLFPRDMTIQEQKREIDEITKAIKAKYGESVDLIIMGEPCTDDMCQYCKMHCDNRVAEFVSRIEWTKDTVTDRDEVHGSADVDDGS